VTETGRPAGRSRTSLLGYGTPGLLTCVCQGWRKPVDPVAHRSYIARGLDIPVSAMTDLVTLTGPLDAAPGAPPQLNLTPTASASPLDSFNGRARG
jgi:hypothetical protein